MESYQHFLARLYSIWQQNLCSKTMIFTNISNTWNGRCSCSRQVRTYGLRVWRSSDISYKKAASYWSGRKYRRAKGRRGRYAVFLLHSIQFFVVGSEHLELIDIRVLHFKGEGNHDEEQCGGAPKERSDSSKSGCKRSLWVHVFVIHLLGSW